MAKDDYDRKTVREKFKDNYLETHAGSRLKALAVHPVIPSMISVQTEDGFKTTVDRASLLENAALAQLYAGTVPVPGVTLVRQDPSPAKHGAE